MDGGNASPSSPLENESSNNVRADDVDEPDPSQLGEHNQPCAGTDDSVDVFGGPDIQFESDPPDAALLDRHNLIETGGPSPTLAELEAFDNLVNQCMLSSQVSDGLTLPWEQGIFRSIFGDVPIWAPPEVPFVMHSIANHLGVAEDAAIDEEPAPKRARTGHTTHGLYDRAITFSNILTDPEIDKNKWARTLEKLYTIFTICPQGCPQGVALDPGDMQGNLDKIRQLCGSRSPGTVLKRANSLLQFCKCHRGFFYQRQPFPFTMCGKRNRTVQVTVLRARLWSG